MQSHARNKAVGFVGLGMMGEPMVETILKKGHSLVIHDIDRRRVERAVGLGATAASSAAEVARSASTLISMVDTTAQAEDVIVGPGGFIETVQPGDVVISMSTIDPVALRAMQKLLQSKGANLIDSPVAGVVQGAKAGTLKAFVGGDPETIEKARPVLESMTSEIMHFGALGQGTTMKLINNMLCQINWVLISEGLVLGIKAGLDPKQMVETILKATGNSVAFQYAAPRILERDFSGVRMDVSFKDIELQLALGRQFKVPMFAAAVGQQVYQMARAQGLGSEDGIALVKVYEQLAGVTVEAH